MMHRTLSQAGAACQEARRLPAMLERPGDVAALQRGGDALRRLRRATRPAGQRGPRSGLREMGADITQQHRAAGAVVPRSRGVSTARTVLHLLSMLAPSRRRGRGPARHPHCAPAAAGGAALPIILMATGLGLIVSAVWAAALGQTLWPASSACSRASGGA